MSTADYGKARNQFAPLAIRAPAKINLFLRVLGRRPDGYHEVATCLHALDLHDSLEIECGPPGVQLELAARTATGLAVVDGDDNLVCRAARAFAAATDLDIAVRFRLHKRVPAGAGLGGGSSDAAAALSLLRAAYDVAIGDAELLAVAASIGADVPFFLRGGTQIGTGRGELLEVVDNAPRYHFALVLPPFGLSTASVYKNLPSRLTDDSYHRSVAFDKAFARKSLEVPGSFANDLEAAAMQLRPELANVCRGVRDRGYGHVRMSGSGSALFIACGDRESAARAVADLDYLREQGCELMQTISDHTPAGGHQAVGRERRGDTRRADGNGRRGTR